MKRLVYVVSVFSVFFILTSGWAVDRALISDNVNTIVTGIDSGKDVMGYKADGYQPYAFIMEAEGKMLVHPTLAGKSLKEAAPPVYDALLKADADGIWVKYQWKGKEKNTYARRTRSNLIVGSGY